MSKVDIRLIAFALCMPVGAAGRLYAQVINEDQKLLANDGDVGDRLGDAIAIEDGLIVAGAWSDDDLGVDSGSVYLFDANTGGQIRKLLANDGQAGSRFGVSVGIDAGLIVVGAHLDAGSGAAYVFSASTGAQLYKLISNDLAAGDSLGRSVAIEVNEKGEGIVIVGAPLADQSGANSGSAYVFDAASGVQLFELIPTAGQAGDSFGFSVSVDQGIVAVGAWGDDHLGSNAGAVYLFDASTGQQIHKLVADDGETNSWFGISVAIESGTVGIGARLANTAMGAQSGAAYLFDAQTGDQMFKLLAGDGEASDWFGFSIDLDQNKVAVGAVGGDDHAVNSGAAYIFDRTSGKQVFKLLPAIGDTDDFFGSAVGIDRGMFAVGARWDHDNGTASGACYVFDIRCDADLTGDGSLNFFDVADFLELYAAQDIRADFESDGVFNFFDVAAFLDSYMSGCP